MDGVFHRVVELAFKILCGSVPVHPPVGVEKNAKSSSFAQLLEAEFVHFCVGGRKFEEREGDRGLEAKKPRELGGFGRVVVP